MKVGYQGIEGSYSEGALLSLFKDAGFLNNFQSFDRLVQMGFPTFDLVFDQLLNDKIDVCLLPIESNLSGTFHSVLDLISSNDVKIQGELQYSEPLCLLGCKGCTIEDIKEIRSQGLILDQCFKFINSTKFEKITLAGDTAEAAKQLSIENSKYVGVIGSKRAAKIYGLEVLKEDVQDDSIIITRFFLISKSGSSQQNIPRHQSPGTFLVVQCKNHPGSFFKVLSCFALREVNISKVESRASKRSASLAKPWEYLLYVEIDGSIGDNAIVNAIENLKEYSVNVNILGSYPRFKPMIIMDGEYITGIGM